MTQDQKAKVTGVSVRILSVPHRLSMSLVMCNLAPRHPPLANQFSRVSSTWGLYKFLLWPLPSWGKK
jgi:hypothetical protein